MIPAGVVKGAAVWLGLGLVVGAPLAAWHGYRRTGSAAWAGAWAAGGLLAAPIVVPVALAQGIGKPGPCSGDPEHATARIGDGCDCVPPFVHSVPGDLSSPCVGVAEAGGAAAAAAYVACRLSGGEIDPASGSCVPAGSVRRSTVVPRLLVGGGVLAAALLGGAVAREWRR